jgi:hypothetical protein
MMAILEAEAHEAAHTKTAIERSELEAVAAATEPNDLILDEAIEQTAQLVDALYLLNGYHKHSRTWRRERNGEI